MAKLTDIPQFSAAVWTVCSRLQWHSREGGMLHGLKWLKDPAARVDDARSLPVLQPLRVSYQSEVFAGAPKDEKKGISKSNTPLAHDMVLSLGLAVELKHGFVQMDPERQASRKGLLEWVGLIQDAIETGTDAVVDARLDNTLYKPVGFALRDPDPGSIELSFHAVLDVILYTRPFCRAERAYTFPEL